MKKLLARILVLALCLMLLPGCGGEDAAADSVELTVFAAASMTETLTELGEQYMRDHENVRILFNFDSSGTLKTQIEEGAEADLFISAGQKQMDALDAAVSPEGLDYLLPGSRFDILENKVVLAVPAGNPAGILSYGALADRLKAATVLLAVGNEDVPVGQYTQKILSSFGLDEDALAASGCLTYGSNAKEVTTQVSEAVVDCGIVYQTDACSAGLTVVDTATAEMCGQVVYPAAVLKNAPHPELAQDFLTFLTSDAADAVFASVGFTPVS